MAGQEEHREEEKRLHESDVSRKMETMRTELEEKDRAIEERRRKFDVDMRRREEDLETQHQENRENTKIKGSTIIFTSLQYKLNYTVKVYNSS